MQKPQNFGPNQFNDFLHQFKNNQAGVGPAQEEIKKSPYIQNHSANSVKPLGLDKNKALAALNNLKNGSVIPKGGQGNATDSSFGNYTF